jgi:hypothetical protein
MVTTQALLTLQIRPCDLCARNTLRAFAGAYACAPGAEKRRERIVRGQRGSDKKESPAGVWARRD